VARFGPRPDPVPVSQTVGLRVLRSVPVLGRVNLGGMTRPHIA
jgi:hypothetical protein